jgi:hypothetical protein
LVRQGYSSIRPAGRYWFQAAETLPRNEIAMHDLIIASSLVAMLLVPCFAAMKQGLSTEDAE